MPTIRRHRMLAAAPDRIWEVIDDPHHLPRWWPGVTRVEDVEEDHFTEVHRTKRGRAVRMDFRVLESEPAHHRSWEQELTATPFERVLRESVIHVKLNPVEGGTVVVLEQRQKMRGYSRTGGFMVRRAIRNRLDDALKALEHIL